MADVITYPTTAKNNYSKLCAVYSLIEQARLEHNRVGRSGLDKAKWLEYSKKFSAYQLPLLEEQNRLRDAIVLERFPNGEWPNLSMEDQTIEMDNLYGRKLELRALPTQAASPQIQKIKEIDLDKLKGAFYDPFENFQADYTEFDAAGRITVTGNQIVIAAEDRDENGYVYKDFGAGHFNALNTLITQTYTTGSLASSFGGCGFSSVVGDLLAWASTAPCGGFYTVNRLILRMGSVYDYYICLLDTPYYCHLERAAGNDNASYKIYSDAARTILLDTLFRSGAGVATYRYCYGWAVAWDGSTGRDFYGTFEDMDLQEAGPPPAGSGESSMAAKMLAGKMI